MGGIKDGGTKGVRKTTLKKNLKKMKLPFTCTPQKTLKLKGYMQAKKNNTFFLPPFYVRAIFPKGEIIVFVWPEPISKTGSFFFCFFVWLIIHTLTKRVVLLSISSSFFVFRLFVVSSITLHPPVQRSANLVTATSELLTTLNGTVILGHFNAPLKFKKRGPKPRRARRVRNFLQLV